MTPEQRAERISESLLGTVLKLDQYELGAIDGCLLRHWIQMLGREVDERRKSEATGFVGPRSAKDDVVAHWQKEVAAAREILDSCRENTNYWMEVDYKNKQLTSIATELESLRVQNYRLTVTIEATAPAAAHGYCGNGSTVAEAVRSLGEMMGKEKNKND